MKNLDFREKWWSVFLQNMLKKQEDSMLWLNKSKKKKMWHCGKVRKCEK